jgi:hypothetical protein
MAMGIYFIAGPASILSSGLTAGKNYCYYIIISYQLSVTSYQLFSVLLPICGVIAKTHYKVIGGKAIITKITWLYGY